MASTSAHKSSLRGYSFENARLNLRRWSKPITSKWANVRASAVKIRRKYDDKWESLEIVKSMHRVLPGWQRNAVSAIAVAFLSFVINLSCTSAVAANNNLDDSWIGTLFEGDCKRAERYNEVAHALLNIMSTLLLASANYYMQVVASPTRKDVDDAHARGEWCDIGMPSFRNSWHRVVKPWRTFVWVSLALTSLPLHLLWNSMFFLTPTSNTYFVTAVNEDYERNGPVPSAFLVDGMNNATTGDGELLPGDLAQAQHDIHNTSLYQPLNPADCINAYAKTFVYDRSDVLIVTKPPSNPSVANQTCPKGHGHPYQATNGDWFSLDCFADSTSSEFDMCTRATCPTTQNITECAESCANTPNCTVARFTASDTRGCYLKSQVSRLHHPGPAEAGMATKLPGPPVVSTNSSILQSTFQGVGMRPYWWMCAPTAGESGTSSPRACHEQALDMAGNWTINEFGDVTATKCYSKLVPQRCRVQFSVLIGLVVTVCNLVKLGTCALVFTILRRRSHKPSAAGPSGKYDSLLLTTGDAIVSYLREPDDCTKDICLAEKHDFVNGIWKNRWVQIRPIRWQVNPQRSWFRAIGLERWIIGSVLCFTIPILAAGYIINRWLYLHKHLGFEATDLWSAGLGEPNALFLFSNYFDTWRTSLKPDMTTGSKFYSSAMLANIPQLVLSVAYATYNSHLTCMLAAREYGEYARGTHALRVSSHPEPGQKSKHFLSLPFWYAASMQAAFAALHYLTSQAVFLANVKVVDYSGMATDQSLNQVGYSPEGLVILAAVGTFVALVAWLQGLRRLPAGMPLAASCSAAISAACHPSDMAGHRDVKHHQCKVEWGVELDDDGNPFIWRNFDGNRFDRGVRHCTFMSGAVIRPEGRRHYA